MRIEYNIYRQCIYIYIWSLRMKTPERIGCTFEPLIELTAMLSKDWKSR